MRFLLIFSIFLISNFSFADELVNQALSAKNSGNHAEALPLWEKLGEKGDKDAMIEAGLIYHQGLDGIPKNYSKALDWYLKAFNGDSLNNMGVMYRDGTGLPQNSKIAYLSFLTVHMTGYGSRATIMRANSNLRRAVAEMPKEEIKESLCYTYAYFIEYVKSRGTIVGIPEELRSSPKQKRIKDLNWWLPGEVEKYDCPSGT